MLSKTLTFYNFVYFSFLPVFKVEKLIEILIEIAIIKVPVSLKSTLIFTMVMKGEIKFGKVISLHLNGKNHCVKVSANSGMAPSKTFGA